MISYFAGQGLNR